MQITLFPSRNILTPSGHCSFLDLYKKMSEDVGMLAEADEVAMLASTDKAAYDAKKDSLPCFTIGRFDNRESGATPTIFESVLVFDLDHIEDPLSLMGHLKTWPYTWICYPSPSMKGLRLFVKADCDIDTRESVYARVAGELSLFSNLPLEEAVPKEKRKVVPIINTSTRNIARFWYYTGIRHFYGNRKAKVYGEKPKVTYTPRPAPATVSPANISKEEVDALVAEIERRKVDITSDYDSWMRAGMGLANELGEDGREAFHKISQFHPDYKHRSTDRKYDNLIATNKGNISLATLFKLAKDSGIEFTFQPRHERQFPEAKFNDRGAETLLNAFLAMHMDNMAEIISRVPSLSEACFRDGANKGVFQTIKFMADKNEFTDPITVHERVGGFYLDIREDAREAVTLEAAVGYAELITSLHRKSEMTKLLLEMSNKVAGGEDIDTVMLSLDTANLSVGASEEDDTIRLAVYNASKRRQELFQRMLDNNKAIPGHSTGIAAEDVLSGGRQMGKLVVIAGRPGMGKTAKALCEALAIAESGVPVGFISLEMPKEELIDRLVCTKASIDSERLSNPTLIDFENGEDTRMQSAEDAIAELPFSMIAEEFHWNAINRRIKKWAAAGVKVVYIDYLQLIISDSKKGENREQEVSKMSRALKEMAKKYKICVVLLSQLSRAVETRGGSKRPQLSDLRESGAIEQDSDIVIFCYRPEYYKIMSDSDGFSTVDTCDLIYAKHRNGKVDTITVGARMKYFWFGDLGQRDFVERAKVPRRNKPIPGAADVEPEEEDEEYDFPTLKQGELDFDNEKELF
jgi:replicative DNA helicase